MLYNREIKQDNLVSIQHFKKFIKIISEKVDTFQLLLVDHDDSKSKNLEFDYEVTLNLYKSMIGEAAIRCAFLIQETRSEYDFDFTSTNREAVYYLKLAKRYGNEHAPRELCYLYASGQF